jgi:hypothetical protein
VEFGLTEKKEKTIPMAMSSTAYDVMNLPDARIGDVHFSEKCIGGRKLL